MKVLYIAYRHDPCNPDLSSGADYQFYTALLRQGCEIEMLGPYGEEPHFIEKGLLRATQRLTNKRYAKFPLSLVWHVSQQLNEAARKLSPDVIFSIFPPAFAFYTGNVPCVYRQDTSFWGWQSQYREFSWLGYQLSMWTERQVFSRCAHIITHSSWNQEILLREYNVLPIKVTVIPNPAALPAAAVPPVINPSLDKQLTSPLRLLFIGRDPVRKGEDVAIEVTKILNEWQYPTELTVCGSPKKRDIPHVSYVGPYKKSIPAEMTQYLSLFRQSHLLLHPARFDPSPIVTSEAAAFGLPTITNNTGGIATSVVHDVSGIVLPKDSRAAAYARAIVDLVKEPFRYYSLCQSARERYEKELNWDISGRRLADILCQVVQDHKIAV